MSNILVNGIGISTASPAGCGTDAPAVGEEGILRGSLDDTGFYVYCYQAYTLFLKDAGGAWNEFATIDPSAETGSPIERFGETFEWGDNTALYIKTNPGVAVQLYARQGALVVDNTPNDKTDDDVNVVQPGGAASAVEGVGVAGADGASAYEIAVAAGFVGDEAAWLASLVGAQGPAGPAGAAGADGADGAQGPQGPQGPAGADGAGAVARPPVTQKYYIASRRVNGADDPAPDFGTYAGSLDYRRLEGSQALLVVEGMDFGTDLDLVTANHPALADLGDMPGNSNEYRRYWDAVNSKWKDLQMRGDDLAATHDVTTISEAVTTTGTTSVGVYYNAGMVAIPVNLDYLVALDHDVHQSCNFKLKNGSAEEGLDNIIKLFPAPWEFNINPTFPEEDGGTIQGDGTITYSIDKTLELIHILLAIMKSNTPGSWENWHTTGGFIIEGALLKNVNEFGKRIAALSIDHVGCTLKVFVDDSGSLTVNGTMEDGPSGWTVIKQTGDHAADRYEFKTSMMFHKVDNTTLEVTAVVFLDGEIIFKNSKEFAVDSSMVFVEGDTPDTNSHVSAVATAFASANHSILAAGWKFSTMINVNDNRLD